VFGILELLVPIFEVVLSWFDGRKTRSSETAAIEPAPAWMTASDREGAA